MNCTSLEEILKGCEGNVGGITTVLVNDQENVSAVTVDDLTWTVTAVTKTAVFVPFEIRRNTGSFTEELQQDLAAGSSFYNQNITLMFSRREASKSRALKVLGEGQRDLAIVIGDANGKFWYFPNAQLQAVSEGSGTAKADGSKYNVVFLAENENLAYEVDAATAAGLTTI